MFTGMAVGTGSAHHAINAMMGGSSNHHAPAPAAPAAQPAYTPAPMSAGVCDMDRKALSNCLDGSSASNCEFYFTALQNCQSNAQN